MPETPAQHALPSPSADRPSRLLFVCLGNICRSPLAEAVFRWRAEQAAIAPHFVLDSCGIGSWHVGQPPDPRTIKVARARGVPIAHRARQFNATRDTDDFDLLIAMDRSNRHAMLAAGAPAERIVLMRAFETPHHPPAPVSLDVPDPYSGDDDAFNHVFDIIDRSCEGLMHALLRRT